MHKQAYFSRKMQVKVVMLFLFVLFCQLRLLAQLSPLHTLEKKISALSFAEKISLKQDIHQFLLTTQSSDTLLSRAKEYLETVAFLGDSLFLADSYGAIALAHEQLGNKEKSETYRTRQQAFLNRLGFHLREITTVGDRTKDFILFKSLQVHKATSKETNLNQLLSEEVAFEYNAPLKQIDSNTICWAKLQLHGLTDRAISHWFRAEDYWNYSSWASIEAYLVHADETIEQLNTSIEQGNLNTKPIQFSLQKAETATLYVRLAKPNPINSPKRITFWTSTVLDDQDVIYCGEPYRFEEFQVPPTTATKVPCRSIFVENGNESTIQDVLETWEQQPKQPINQVNLQEGKTYWAKLRLASSPLFNGDQFFQIGGKPLKDRYSFDHIDIYTLNASKVLTKQELGVSNDVTGSYSSFDANLVRLDLPLNDTLDVYVRMSGINPRFPLSPLAFWHIKPALLQTIQNELAFKDGLFYGVLALQSLFFLLFFLIERASIHLFFAMISTGIFLALSFSTGYYACFISFPFWRAQHEFFIHSGHLLIQVGLLQFTTNYFQLDKSSFLTSRFIPVFLSVCLIVFVAALFVQSGFYLLTITILLTLVSLITSLLIGFFIPKYDKISKAFFLIAFVPPILMGLVFLGRLLEVSLFHTNYISSFLPSEQLNDWFKYSIVALLFFLALSIGNRINRLKAEKQLALEKEFEAQKTIIEQLKQTNALQELDELKNRFYTNITHEFRTPLTVILGMTEQKNDPNALPLIRKNGMKLLNLINQILDLSKLESGNLKPNMVQLEMVAFTQYIGESFQSFATQQDIRLMIYSEIQQLWMDTDEVKYQQIVENLLANAIKYTPSGGKIILHLIQRANKLILKVTDNGIGITQEDLPHIFDRFYQANPLAHQDQGGTGIGLALVKELITLLNGEIQVNSKLEKGTTFEVVFPIHVTAPKKIFTPPTFEEVFTSDEDTSTLQKKELPRLLLIEDNLDVIAYVKSLLRDRYQLKIAYNGEEGIEKALLEIPDIIISDIMMPKKDGYEVVNTLKNDWRTSHIPIVLLTAKVGQEEKIQGLKYGADVYLMKPFDKNELLIRLDNLVKLRQKLQEKYNGFQPTETQPSNKEEDFLNNLHQIVENQLNNGEFRVDDFPKILGMSRSQFYRKLKALTNLTPSQFLRQARFKKGKYLLEKSDLTITEIAYEIGFNDPNYFIRIFTKEFGQSPNNFRKSMQINF